MSEAKDESKAARAAEWVEMALDENHQFTDEFLSSSNWVVVPVESAAHFSELDAECIARAASIAGKASLRAILLEDLKQVKKQVDVDVSKEGLSLFSRECGLFNYALVPDDASFAIICTTYDYFLVAGPRRFVEMALGKDILEARSAFAAFATDESWSEAERLRFDHLARPIHDRLTISVPDACCVAAAPSRPRLSDFAAPIRDLSCISSSIYASAGHAQAFGT